MTRCVKKRSAFLNKFPRSAWEQENITKETPTMKKTLFSLVFITSTLAGLNTALAETKSPKYSFLRFQENWSSYKDIPESRQSDFYDPIKYIPLNDEGDIYLSMGGRANVRMESWFDFGYAKQNDDTFFVGQALLHADLHLTQYARIFVEGKYSTATGRVLPGGRRTLNVDEGELQQAFVDIAVPLSEQTKLTVRVGRRELLKGKQRLLSPLPWGQAHRTWDGFSAILDTHGWNIEGFWTQFVPVQKYSFNDPDSDNQLFGIYGTGKVLDNTVGLDLYWLGIERGNKGFNGSTGNEHRHTMGGRAWGKMADNFDYEVEGAYQFGSISGQNIDAFMVASQLGYKRNDLMGKPRFYLGFDYASGDDNAGGSVQTFNQLFPLGHAYLGFMDFVGRQNSIDFSHGVSFSPMPKMMTKLSGHKFWRADNDDAFYNAGGGAIRSGGSGSSSDLGYEIDVTTLYKFSKHLKGLIGYSHFFAGDFVKQSGSSKDMDFIYTQLNYTF